MVVNSGEIGSYEIFLDCSREKLFFFEGSNCTRFTSNLVLVTNLTGKHGITKVVFLLVTKLCLIVLFNWYLFFHFCLSSSLHRHWLTSTYIMFAVPYFVYDIYAMFMCYWYKLRVKGHEEASAAPQHMSTALTSYLRREFLMVLHHVVMVTVCFPVSVVTVTHCSLCWAEIWVRQGKILSVCNCPLLGSFYHVQRDNVVMGKYLFIYIFIQSETN